MRTVLAAMGGLALLAALTRAATGSHAAAPLLVNESPSVPRGLYLRTPAPPARGDLVAAAPPPAARPYLVQTGAPPGQRLLKRVAAKQGDPVCVRAGALLWPGGSAPVRRRDRNRRPLPQWAECRVLRAGEVLLVGDSAASFDSRYFGPVDTAAIEGVYKEVWRW